MSHMQFHLSIIHVRIISQRLGWNLGFKNSTFLNLSSTLMPNCFLILLTCLLKYLPCHRRPSCFRPSILWLYRWIISWTRTSRSSVSFHFTQVPIQILSFGLPFLSIRSRYAPRKLWSLGIGRTRICRVLRRSRFHCTVHTVL